MISYLKATLVKLIAKPLAFACVACTVFTNAQADHSKVFVQSTEGIKGFGGLVTRDDGKLLLAGQPKNIRIFNPSTRKFEGNDYILQFFSFADDLVNVPFVGYSIASFLDGRVPTVKNDHTVTESNVGIFDPAPNTGKYPVTASRDLIGIDPITYRDTDDLLYAASSFNSQQLFRFNWRGNAPPEALNLTPPLVEGYALNAFQFGPDRLLYSPDVNHGRIVSINVDAFPHEARVTPVLNGLITPIALKIDRNGILYFAERRTGKVWSYNLQTQAKKLLAKLEPALDNLALSLDQTKLYVTNDENKIYEIDIRKKKAKILFSSPIVQPWDIAFDSGFLYLADFGSIKKFDATTGQLVKNFILDTTKSGLGGKGQASGITVEKGKKGKIIITDITIGNVMVVDKETFKFYKAFDSLAQNTGLAFTQPFSTVRVVTDEAPGEYYLATSPSNIFDSTTPGKIIRFQEDPNDPTGVSNSIFFDGLFGPVKLILSHGYVYVVEAGDLLNDPPLSPGRISRIPLNNPSTREILVDNLNNPQGLDIFDDGMYIVEVGTQRLLGASAVVPSEPKPIQTNLDLSDEVLIYQFGPMPINPFAGVAVDDRGKHVWVNHTETDAIIQDHLH